MAAYDCLFCLGTGLWEPGIYCNCAIGYHLRRREREERSRG